MHIFEKIPSHIEIRDLEFSSEIEIIEQRFGSFPSEIEIIEQRFGIFSLRDGDHRTEI